METQERQNLADKQRIVIKIGSSSLTHAQTGEVNLMKIEKLVRVISDLRDRERTWSWCPPAPLRRGGRPWAVTGSRIPLLRSRPLRLWARPGS